MRKITTLLALGALATSAFATTLPGVKGQLEDYKLTAEGQQMINTMHAQLNAGLDVTELNGMQRVVKKSYEDNTYVWEINMLVNSTNWYEVLQYSDGTNPTFYDMPYYWVYYVLQGTRKADSKRVTVLQVPLMWPTMYMWEQNADPQLPNDERNMDLVTATQMFEATEGMQRGKSFIYDGQAGAYYGDSSQTWLGFFPIAPNSWYGGDGWPMLYNGAETTLKDGDDTKFSQIDLTTMDSEEKTYHFDNTFYFANNSTLNLSYNGEARMMGFVKENYEINFLNEPHVIYTGVESAESLGWDNNYDDTTWGPFSKFFIIAPTDDCFVGYVTEDRKWDQDWQSVLGIGNNSPDNGYGYVTASLFKEAETANDDPYGYWNLFVPTIETSDKGTYLGNNMVPALHRLIPTGYNAQYMPWADMETGDGITFVLKNYYTFFEGGTRLVIGDKADGFLLYGYDNYGNYYKGTYNGDIIMHYNPADLNEYKNIPAVGSIDGVKAVKATDANILVNGGIITVLAGEELTASVFTLDGQMVKSAPVKAGEVLDIRADKGIYVVKAGNLVKKVVL